MLKSFIEFEVDLPVWISNSNLQRNRLKIAQKYKGKCVHLVLFHFTLQKWWKLLVYMVYDVLCPMVCVIKCHKMTKNAICFFDPFSADSFVNLNSKSTQEDQLQIRWNFVTYLKISHYKRISSMKKPETKNFFCPPYYPTNHHPTLEAPIIGLTNNNFTNGARSI